MFAPEHTRFKTSSEFYALLQAYIDRDPSLSSLRSRERMQQRLLRHMHLVRCLLDRRVKKQLQGRAPSGLPVEQRLEAFYSKLLRATTAPVAPPTPTELLLATSITLSMSIMEGLRGTPMYMAAFRSLSSQLISVLGTAVSGLPPLHNAAASPHTQAIKTWDSDLSMGCSISIIEDGTVAQIGGPESKKRFVMARPSSPAASLAVSLAGNNSDLELSFGLFERTGDSFQPLFCLNSLSSGAQFHNSRKLRSCRSLRPGDIVVITVNSTEGWGSISLLGEGGSRLRQSVEARDVFVGVKMRCTQTLKIVPHLEESITAVSESQCLCRASHEMRLCHSISDTNYSSSSVVNCDGCPRRGIHRDALPFHHCGLCHYDQCATCALLSKKPEEHLEGDEALTGRSVPAFGIHEGSPQWLAIDQVTRACTTILDEPGLDLFTLQKALSLQVTCAVMRFSLSDMLECIDRMQRLEIQLVPEVAPILTYLTSSAMTHDSSLLETVARILRALSGLHTCFRVSRKEDLDSLASIVSNGIRYFTGISDVTDCSTSEFQFRDQLLGAALDMITRHFARIEGIADLPIDTLDAFRESSLVRSLMTNVRSMMAIRCLLPGEHSSADAGIRMLISTMNSLSSPVAERRSLISDLLEKHGAGAATPLEATLLQASLKDVTYSKFARHMALRCMVSGSDEWKDVMALALTLADHSYHTIDDILACNANDEKMAELHDHLVRTVEIYCSSLCHDVFSALSTQEFSNDLPNISSQIGVIFTMFKELLKVANKSVEKLVVLLSHSKLNDGTYSILRRTPVATLLPLICRTLQCCLMSKLHETYFDEIFNVQSADGLFSAILPKIDQLSVKIPQLERILKANRDASPVEVTVDESVTQQEMVWDREISSTFLIMNESQVDLTFLGDNLADSNL